MSDTELVVYIDTQKAELWVAGQLTRVFNISTAINGPGNELDSFRTPTGELRVEEKVGDGAPLRTVFKGRVAIGVLGEDEKPAGTEPLTRILWLGRSDEEEAKLGYPPGYTQSRYIYLCGTRHEDKLGTPNSQGSIVFSNADIMTVHDAMKVGDKVTVVPPRASPKAA